MTQRPRLLDLYCCEGGSSMGYHEAGFDVYGVDIFMDYTRARYPFPSIKADVLTVLASSVTKIFKFQQMKTGVVERLSLREFDVIAASPPCQLHSITNAARRFNYPDLIGFTRVGLLRLGKPYVLENVVGAPLIDPVMLCGRQFGLSATDYDGTPLVMDRHRLFESNVDLWVPEHPPHDTSQQVAGSYGGARRDKAEARNVRHGGYVPSVSIQQELLGINWMTQKGMHQSIPPVYTEYLGKQLMMFLGVRYEDRAVGADQ